MRVDVGTCATILSDATDCDDQLQWVAPIALCLFNRSGLKFDDSSKNEYEIEQND